MIKMIVYSPPGHGKTTFIGSGARDARLDPMLFLDFEAGGSSIQSKLRRVEIDDIGKTTPEPGIMDQIRITAWDDFEDILDLLLGEHPYNAVAIDSLSEVNFLSLQSCVAYATSRRATHDPDIPEQQDYMRNAVRMRKLVRYFRDLDMSVIFTAGSQSVDGVSQPNLTGRLPADIIALVDTVGYLGLDDSDSDKGITRFLVTSPTPHLTAKDRSEGGKLGEGIADPTLPKVLDLLEGDSNA